jgi:hypothetical protein
MSDSAHGVTIMPEDFSAHPAGKTRQRTAAVSTCQVMNTLTMHIFIARRSTGARVNT